MGTDDADVFDIDEGVLTFKQSPNYEDPSGWRAPNTVLNVTVVATDSDDEPAMAMAMVTVMVTNVDEAGTLTLSTLQPVDGIDVTATLTDIDSVTDGNPTGTVTADDITGSGPSPSTMRAPTPTLTRRRRPTTRRNRPT